MAATRLEAAENRSFPLMCNGIVSRPALFAVLSEARRVVQISAPAGSGKTALLCSWVRETGRAADTAWVWVQPGERDPAGFWTSIVDALRTTAAGSAVVDAVSAAPRLDGWAVVERLLKNLDSLDAPIWLVIDDVHELLCPDALGQLERLLTRGPPELRVVLATRRDLHIGLHRLRLDGELTEIRTADLRFGAAESRALLEAAGVAVSESAIAVLHERTEGWAAGLRLAALSLAGRDDSERFAAEFSGSERTVAEYLLAEVLERQPEDVRRLLLRTSMLDQVSGPLADFLTGGSGGERILQELEEANAFVVSLDPGRSWFRYHRLFAELLQLEMRRTAPGEIPKLHAAAAGWFAEHGEPIYAIRCAQAAENWSLAARLLSDHWLGLGLRGHSMAVHDLLSRLPAAVIAAEPELAAVVGIDETTGGSLDEGERKLRMAVQGSASVPAARRGQFDVALTILRLLLALKRGDLSAVVARAQRFLDPPDGAEAMRMGLGEDLRALALISLGVPELWMGRYHEADLHLQEALSVAQRIGEPYLEVCASAPWALIAGQRSPRLGIEAGMRAIELARRHGWHEDPTVGIAYLVVATMMVSQGRLDESEPWLEQAERTLRVEVQPGPAMLLNIVRGLVELAHGRADEALAAFASSQRRAGLLVTPTGTRPGAFVLQALVRKGELDEVEAALASATEDDRESAEFCAAVATLRLAQGNPAAAARALVPVLDGAVRPANRAWLVQAFLLEAIARDALGDADAAERALERALDIAEPDGLLLPFLLHPAPELLARHARHRTKHAALLATILDMLAGKRPPTSEPAEPLREPLSETEIRVLRFLPTNMSAPEIAAELYVSVNTVRTHMRHLYAKLGAHSRTQAVERARGLALLAPSHRS